MTDLTGDTAGLPGGDLVTVAAGRPTHAGDPPLSAAGKAALAAAKALGRKAAAPATLRAYKGSTQHSCCEPQSSGGRRSSDAQE